MSAWCDTCHRMIGVGCACGLSFAEKVRTLTIHNDAMPNKTKKKYWDQQAVSSTFGDDATDRVMEETKGVGFSEYQRQLSDGSID